MSATSANALLSDLRPTTLAPQALDYVNLLLDELLVAIVTSSESINVHDFRTRGVPAALSESESSRNARGAHPAALGALGRAAVGEAEVEIRSWYAGHPTAQKDISGFPPDGKGRGLVAGREEVRSPFPVQAAVDLMRVKVASLSVRVVLASCLARTPLPSVSPREASCLASPKQCHPQSQAETVCVGVARGAPRRRSDRIRHTRGSASLTPQTFADSADPIPEETYEEATGSWKTAGGDVSEETVAPAGLWLTAVLE